MARLTNQDLAKLTVRKGHGIASSIGRSGIVSEIGNGSARPEAGDPRAIDNVERNPADEPVGPVRLQIKSSGKIRVRIKFFRYRLADYSRAISEKALVDCLQYAGLIPNDSEKEIWLEDEGQVKVGSREEEKTEIVLHYEGVDYDNPHEIRDRKDGR